MITSSIDHKQHLLASPGHKELVRDQLKELEIHYHLVLAAWVIMDNHYHILVRSHIGNELSSFLQRLHGRTSHDINRLDQVKGRRVWDNYWDTCMRNEADYWTRFNYIHHNPVKHGYVRMMNDWLFSSYSHYLKHKGEDWLADVFSRYPIVDFTDPADGS